MQEVRDFIKGKGIIQCELSIEEMLQLVETLVHHARMLEAPIQQQMSGHVCSNLHSFGAIPCEISPDTRLEHHILVQHLRSLLGVTSSREEASSSASL